MIGGRLLFRELRIAFGQALQLGALRGRAFSDGAHRQPVGKRYWIRRNGKPSTKVPEATASQIAERIRR